MRKKKILGQIDALIAKNSELYNDNVAMAKELENKKMLICELEDKISQLESELEEAKNEPAVPAVTEAAEICVDVSETETELDVTVTEEVEQTVEKDADEDVSIHSVGTDTADASVSVQNNQDIDSASAVIGKVVIKCAELCNIFTLHGGPNAKDLVNLALGRTEVFKSEILQLVTEYEEFADAKAEVDLKVASINEYFDLLKKQL